MTGRRAVFLCRSGLLMEDYRKRIRNIVVREFVKRIKNDRK